MLCCGPEKELFLIHEIDIKVHILAQRLEAECRNSDIR